MKGRQSLSFLLLSVPYFFLFLWNEDIKCQSLLPVSYASHQMYSFDKLTPHEIKSDLKKTFGNFISSKIQVLKNKFKLYDIKNREKYNNEEGNDSDLIGDAYISSLEDEIKHLLEQAENKRMLSKKIKSSYERAHKNLKKRRNVEDDGKMKNVLKQNLQHIDYLNKKSDYLEKKAGELKNILERRGNENAKEGNDNDEKNIYNNEYHNNCSISKRGTLKFINSSNGLKHSIDNVNGMINENGFTIFYKNKKKMTYFWSVLELPIKMIGSIEQCFYFIYKNNNQIFCADNKIKAYSWMNSLSEASLCFHFGIKGVLINSNINNINKNDDMNNTNDENVKHSDFMNNISNGIKQGKKNKQKKIDENSLTVDIKPEDTGTRIFVNDVEQKINKDVPGKDNVFNLNDIKKKMDDERKTPQSENDEDQQGGYDKMEENEKEDTQMDNDDYEM
ncbi:hypothetical protein PFAG_02154 [Plasmodium falciparum Santa Lucia]|uniref:PH domain-containing protein n=3 Tax=Plasmodium falciparum TaxID=5833 RepID=C0H4X9_PLAF7|nr:conserved protein, unknown function [Plasmodium falciparum 3D7]EUT87332.1 hypothetical protein PFAG_02154 [Plasmodium falciparum Santa Lucia]EWC88812.1 hypothetical protein PFNF54_02325 [Plasmodium falciparum NF54]KAF4330285.1 hypothetical protein CYL21_1354 [Plasmodium falciparum NF54]PKC47562.1 hypothetical protein CK202_2456 [Plasmodium falciparum NF54]CAX64157.2 conserved protein, unknown function [Plasmodium falciparum 3D7]|eukprot:XP_002808879.2 conserved Plasmodium protein, unknown function [Plasmodium falciparum 3D7]